MENKYKKFDDLLKEKVGNSSFPMKEAHWEDALRRLDEEDDDKKRPLLWIFLIGALVLGALVTSGNYFLNKSKDAQPLAIQNNLNPVKVAQYAEEEEYAFKEEIITQKQLAQISSNQEERQSIQNLDSYSTPYNEESDATFADGQNDYNFTQASMPSTQSNFVSNNQTKDVASKSDKNSVDHNGADKLSAQGSMSPAAAVLNHNKNKNIKVDLINPQNSAPAKSRTAEDLAKAEKPSSKLSGGMSPMQALKLDAQKNGSAGPNVPTSMRTNDPNKKIRSVLIKDKDYFRRLNPRYVDGLENYEAVSIDVEAIKSPVATTAPEQKEKVEKAKKDKKVASTPKMKPYRQPLNQQKRTFSLVLGVGANQGFGPVDLNRSNQNLNTSTIPQLDDKYGLYQQSRSWGVTPILGLEYIQPISNRLNLTTGVLMSYLGKLNVEERVTQTSYSFDKTMSQFKLERKGLLQLHMPLLLGYRLNSKHELLAGPAFTYNLTSYSQVQDFGSLGDLPVFGYEEGIKKTDFSLVGAYRYSLSDRIKMRVSYQYGFGDLLDDSYFKASFKDVQRRISLGMSWSIFK